MQLLRWLYLSGLVFAVLIPAGWQMGPKDSGDTSRYGALEVAGGGGGCRGSSALSAPDADGSPGSGAIATCPFLLYLSGQAPSWLSASPRRAMAVCPPPQQFCVRPETGTRWGRAGTGRWFGHGAEPPSAPAQTFGGASAGVNL